MFQYEYEKQRPPSASSCDSGLPQSTRCGYRVALPPQYARRPLPPTPDQVRMPRTPVKSTVPLKVWVIATASCFAVCAILVLATIAITRWGSVTYSNELYERPEQIYADSYQKVQQIKPIPTTTVAPQTNDDNEVQILERLSRFKNAVANRERKKTEPKNVEGTLLSKTQFHPLEDTAIEHEVRKIEKKDQAMYDETRFNEINVKKDIPDFRPTLPDVFVNQRIFLPDGYTTGLKKIEDYQEYYNDDDLYEDYMQSNTMTSYLIEKIQELYDWITTDPDFVVHNSTMKHKTSNDFRQVLQALNESLVEGNATIIMTKLKDLYFGDNFTAVNRTRKVILPNSTDLLSFGILTLDVMLLHNIQMMAWENQEAAKVKMLKDPDVFAFNALFLEQSKVEAKQNEVNQLHDKPTLTRRTNRIETVDDFDFGRNLLENILEIGMSTARAAIHLGRAYKNTKVVLNQISNRDSSNTSPHLISRNIDSNSLALTRLQTSFDSSRSVANSTVGFHTDLDCIWLLYCRNLAATAKLNAPYGTMARINGIALRMLTGELAADKALDTMLYEALSGWTELRCSDMFPRCSKVNAASIVMDTIKPTHNKSTNRAR